jgi:hypothetical protein
LRAVRDSRAATPAAQTHDANERNPDAARKDHSMTTTKVAETKTRHMDASEIRQRFGWTDAQCNQAALYGMPVPVGLRTGWSRLRPRDVRVWNADEVESWFRDLAAFVGSTRGLED